MSIELIRLENLSKKYLNVTFNLSIFAGEILIIHGKNGSGKSTLIKLILKFIKPDSGRIIGNVKAISYLQERAQLPGYLKVLDYLILISKLKKVPLPLDYMAKFAVPLNIEIQKLSKGNKQKVSLITALIGTEKLLLLDEPLSGLDKNTQVILKRIIKELKGEKAIIISTHKPALFRKIADREILIC